MTKKRLLLVGWDSADWKIINPILDSGGMPALESLVKLGDQRQLDHPRASAFSNALDLDRHRQDGLPSRRSWVH